jgi:UDP-N-acetylmuramoylalanine--D-glutamate ligase
MEGRVSKLIVMGEAAGRIAQELDGAVETVRVGGMEEAVAAAARAARRGSVLLSPACSSFDSYRDYAERGRHFQDEVRKL